VNPRRNVPNVEGARTSVKTWSMPPWRSRSMSSMLSAPASIPPTSDITFAPAVPCAPGTVSHSSARSRSPIRSANTTAGTNPADAIRFGSSSTADSPPGVWHSCISEMPSWVDSSETSQSPYCPPAGHFRCHDPNNPPPDTVD
jgi:hypothetical protein